MTMEWLMLMQIRSQMKKQQGKTNWLETLTSPSSFYAFRSDERTIALQFLSTLYSFSSLFPLCISGFLISGALFLGQYAAITSSSLIGW